LKHKQKILRRLIVVSGHFSISCIRYIEDAENVKHEITGKESAAQNSEVENARHENAAHNCRVRKFEKRKLAQYHRGFENGGH